MTQPIDFYLTSILEFSVQVCVHIIDSVHTEMIRMKEEWEVSCSKAPPPPPPPPVGKAAKQVSIEVPSSSPSTSSGGGGGGGSEQQESDSYCFELLSMLIGLSQSEVGCSFLAEQDKLVHDLFTLLHVSTLRIQLQVRFTVIVERTVVVSMNWTILSYYFI